MNDPIGAHPPAAPLPLDEFGRSSREVAMLGYVLTVRLLDLLDRFRAAEVPVLVLKGPVLSQLLHGDPTVRSYGDLDLLVRREDIPRAAHLLEQDGYRIHTAFDWVSLNDLIALDYELSFQHELGAAIDLHWDIAPGAYPFRLNPEVLWASMELVEIFGRPVPSLNAECLLLFLCLHATKHAWARITWVRDVERLVAVYSSADGANARRPLDWSGVLALSERSGCERPLLLGVLLAHELFGAGVPVPEHVVARARAIPAVARLAEEARQRLKSVPGPAPTSFELAHFSARLTERAWEKIQLYATLLKAPTKEDVHVLRLPPALFFLYYPFRMIRLAGKYALRLVRPGG